MKEEIYRWVRSLAVYYITLTAVMHMIPEGRYEKYVRFFMGILLVFMLCVPFFSLLGQGEELLSSFEESFLNETARQKEEEAINIQEIWLRKEYEGEIGNRIRQVLANEKLEPDQLQVEVDAFKVKAVLVYDEELSEERKRSVENELEKECGLEKGNYSIETAGIFRTAVGDSSAGGNPSGGSGTSGERE